MKLVWEKYVGRPRSLYARMSYEHGAVTVTGLNESHLVPVQQWCQENDCGKRISYDTFVFRNLTEMSVFLLKWS